MNNKKKILLLLLPWSVFILPNGLLEENIPLKYHTESHSNVDIMDGDDNDESHLNFLCVSIKWKDKVCYVYDKDTLER